MMLKMIGRIQTGFPTKFGIPRQSGLVQTRATIVFEEEYRNPDALRGIENFSHLWLIWGFSEVKMKDWHPTVRPPRLGGNERVGVFATRSPYRPNPLGLSSVRLEGVEQTAQEGMVLHVSGADLMDGTPIYDIKPYLAYVDSHPEAEDGFAGRVKGYALKAEIPEKWIAVIPEEERNVVRELLAQDPRPSYHDDPDRIYGMEYAGLEIRFQVRDGIARVCEVEEQ